MQSRDFCYWLQGFFEISGAKREGGYEITDEQIDIIRNHLNMVFIHEIDPSFPSHQQDALNNAHKGDAIEQHFSHKRGDGAQVLC